MAVSGLPRLVAGVFAFFLSAATFGTPALASPQPDFECEVRPHPLLEDDGFLLGRYIYFIEEDVIGLTGEADLPEQLPRVVSGSGMQFSNGAITFGAKGDSGFLELNDGTLFPCKAVTASLIPEDAPQVPVPASPSVPAPPAVTGQNPEELALALGTIVRAGPDAQSVRIERLPANEPVTLVRETGTYLNGFQWFEISYSEGQRGYAWGGTLCVDTEMAGILIDCRRHAGMTAQQALTGGSGQQTGQQGGQQNGQPSAMQPSFGQSLFGSIVRSAADPNARRLGSIPQGAALTFIAETGSFFDGWQWVRVRYGNGREGFVWGGTVCVTQGRKMVGVHETCG